MGRRYVLIIFAWCMCGHFVMAQSDCDQEVEDGKISRLYKKTQDIKLDDRERIELSKELVSLYPECMPCRMQLARLLFLKAKYGNISYSLAKEQYLEIINQCPDFHSDPYYYIGLIAYGRQNFEDAIYYFKQYLNFDSSEPKAFARDYEKKVADIEDILPELVFYESFNKDSVSFNPVRVAGVSSKADEYLPAISADHELLFYTRKSDKKAKGDLFSRMVEEITLSRWADSLSRYSNGKPLPKPFNMGDNYGGISVSADGREIFLTICKDDLEGYKNCDIYTSHYHRYLNEDDQYQYKWSEPEPLGKEINGSNTWEAQPSICADGATLYFASFKEQDNMMDIYVSHRDANGNWATAQPLSDINTTGNDKAPFIHPDGKTLFFSSDNRLGAGGYDLYMSRKTEKGGWTKPKNLGQPINTRDDEHGLIASTDGRHAFFASSRIEGSKGLDIYKFELPYPVRPKKMTVIKGNISAIWSEEHKGAEVALKNIEKDHYIKARIDSSDGAFTAVVSAEDSSDLVLTVSKPGFAFQSKLILSDDIEQGKPIAINLNLEEIIPGKSYRINDINYATNSAEIMSGSKLVLQEFAFYLKENPQLIINIYGHTDNVGAPADNLKLSELRAQSVKNYLIDLGVSASRLDAKGFGESMPLADNTTAIGRAKNRRTEFQIVKK